MQRVLVVDDRSEARQRAINAVNVAHEPDLVLEAATLVTAKRHLRKHSFDLAILDLALPDGKGETLIPLLKEGNPECFIFIWTINDQPQKLADVLSFGVNGYLLKDLDETALSEAFRRSLFGEPPMSACVTRRVLEFMHTAVASAKASARGHPHSRNACGLHL